MQLPYSEELNTGYLARLFDNTSECYKLFWFKAIVHKVFTENRTVLTYEELIDKMIADAWYMVTEYHLNLGPNDTLEKAVNRLKLTNPGLKSSAKEQTIIDLLSLSTDKELLKYKRTLTLNVPYRLQAPFLPELKGKAWDVKAQDLITRINQERLLMYYFGNYNSLSTEITVQDEWANYIRRNYEIIMGWIEYNMIQYLQRRNPSVPGISDKLYPPEERKLEKVKKYWKLILSFGPINEIYNNELITDKNISIDHFVPWSYVAHDEFWNLSPTTKSINSSKSNNLPEWDIYFKRLAALEYRSYQLIWDCEAVHKEFESCAREHINSTDVRGRLFREGQSLREFTGELETLILPVYKSAQNCGFSEWVYTDKWYDKRLSI
ncbi:HNH endonuclease [Ruminococcaceae bacterium YRB3002]|nr:HNH endonuclease [Ruminococcaceae bacterium YRB3002]